MTSSRTDCVPRRASEKIRSRWHYLKCNAMRRSKCNQCELNSPTGTSTKRVVEAGLAKAGENPAKSRGRAAKKGRWNQSHNPNQNPAQVRSGIGVSSVRPQIFYPNSVREWRKIYTHTRIYKSGKIKTKTKKKSTG